MRVTELTDLVTKDGEASPEVWGEAVDGSGVRERLWNGQSAFFCGALSQLQKHLHGERKWRWKYKHCKHASRIITKCEYSNGNPEWQLVRSDFNSEILLIRLASL